MEHIRLYDWCTSEPETTFLKEEDLDNCITDRIIRNRFRDPLISSDSEDDTPKPAINWDEVFKKKNNEDRQHRVFVAGLRKPPAYPKLSALTKQQHFQCLKVLCAENPNVLPMEFMLRPTKMDHRLFEELKETYLKEQQEYIEWAKTLWTTSHCVRALRPKPTIENVYEAQYKMKASELGSFPKNYNMAAHIPLYNKNNKCELIHKQNLIKVDHTNLPQVEYPRTIDKKLYIMRPCPVPEPCNKHPCWFVLPNEKSMSVLPLTEIHRELAQFASDNGAQIIASEGALKCLIEVDRQWLIPLTVCEVIDTDGETQNVIVFGSEFSTNKKSPMERTYSAYRHLVEYALIPPKEKLKRMNNDESTANESSHNASMDSLNSTEWMDVSSDDDEDQLVIDEDDCPLADIVDKKKDQPLDNNDKNKEKEGKPPEDKPVENESNKKKNDFYNCSCKDSMFENPPPRSYQSIQVRGTNRDTFNMIVHCSHKMKDPSGEVIVEPIPEYQLDLGGSGQSDDKLKSLALSLFLRKNASLLNVRVDSVTGDVVTIDNITQEKFKNQHGDLMKDVSKIIYETVNQLQGLLPGHYILQHETDHGPNAMLFAPKVKNSERKLVLDFNMPVTAESDDAKGVQTAPVLTPVLLPIHKFRKMLPCAFTPFENMLAQEQKKPVAKQKAPPQAIRWPRRARKQRPGVNHDT